MFVVAFIRYLATKSYTSANVKVSLPLIILPSLALLLWIITVGARDFGGVGRGSRSVETWILTSCGIFLTLPLGDKIPCVHEAAKSLSYRDRCFISELLLKLVGDETTWLK